MNPSQNDLDEAVAVTSKVLEAHAGRLPKGEDVVNRPKHYKVFVEVEAIDLIAGSMTERAFHGYCMGNVLKYRLRAGKKTNALEDLAKADKYEALYMEKRHLCREYAL